MQIVNPPSKSNSDLDSNDASDDQDKVKNQNQNEKENQSQVITKFGLQSLRPLQDAVLQSSSSSSSTTPTTTLNPTTNTATATTLEESYSPLPSPSKSMATVQAWLNDQGGNNRGKNTLDRNNHLLSQFNAFPMTSSNQLPTSTSTTTTTTTNNSSPSEPRPPPIQPVVNESLNLPPINHGTEVWVQLHDAMHNENQKLRARLTLAENKAEGYKRERDSLKQQLESLRLKVAGAQAQAETGTETETETETEVSQPRQNSQIQIPQREHDDMLKPSPSEPIPTSNIYSNKTIANTALREVDLGADPFSTSSSSNSSQYQLPTGFSIGGYEPSTSTSTPAWDRRGSTQLETSDLGLHSEMNNLGNRNDRDPNPSSFDSDPALVGIHPDVQIQPSSSKRVEEKSQTKSIKNNSSHDDDDDDDDDADADDDDYDKNSIVSNPNMVQNQNHQYLGPGGWHNHGLSGFDSGSSRINWSHVGELNGNLNHLHEASWRRTISTTGSSSEGGFSHSTKSGEAAGGGSSSGGGESGLTKKKFELHLPGQKEREKAKRKEREKGREKEIERDRDRDRDQDKNDADQEDPTELDKQQQQQKQQKKNNSYYYTSTPKSTSSTSTLTQSQTDPSLPQSQSQPQPRFESESLPETSSWGALISAHVAHLNETFPYAIVEKDRLERILASSSSSRSQGSSNSSRGTGTGVGIGGGMINENSSNFGNASSSTGMGMTRSLSSKNHHHQERLSPSSFSFSSTANGNQEGQVRDSGNPSILTSSPISPTSSDSKQHC